MNIDIEYLKTWIGKTEEYRETISAAPMAGFAATLDHVGGGDPQVGDCLLYTSPSPRD